MILDHIPHRPGSIIIFPSILHPQSLSSADLDGIDIIMIPQWLENTVREAQYQDILHGLFPQIMVDTINLLLMEDMS